MFLFPFACCQLTINDMRVAVCQVNNCVCVCVLLSPDIETVREYEVQFHQRLEQERAQWAQYRETAEREMAELRRRLSEGQEEENLENEMKKVDRTTRGHTYQAALCWFVATLGHLYKPH